MITIKDLCKTYHNPAGDVAAVRHLSVNLPDKGLVIVTGKSGCGKTTLLNLLGGLDAADSGSLFYDSTDVTRLTEEQWDSFRNEHIGIIFQDYNLLDELTVYENVILPLKIQKDSMAGKEQADITVKQIVEDVGLGPFLDTRVDRLSGGQRQRVAIARSLVKNPQVILADEPTGNLDSGNSEQIFSIFRTIAKNCLVFLITHDESSAMTYGDRVLHISDGTLISDWTNSANSNRVRYAFSLDETTANGEKKETAESVQALTHLLYEHADPLKPVQVQVTVLPKPEEETDKNHAFHPLPEKRGKAGSMPIREVLRVALPALRHRRVRLALTIAIFSVTVFCLFSLLLITTCDYTHTVVKYFERYDTASAIMEKTYPESVHAASPHGNTVPNGPSVLADAVTLVGENRVLRYGTTYLSAQPYGAASNDNLGLISASSAYLATLPHSGQIPAAGNEILLSESVASDMGLTEEDFGKNLYRGSRTYRFVGIVKGEMPDYDKSNAGKKQTEYAMLTGGYTAYVSSDYHYEEKENAIYPTIVRGSLTGYVGLSGYQHQQTMFSSVAWLEATEENSLIISGRLPDKPGEIAICAEYLKDMFPDDDAESVCGTVIRTLNIQDPKYDGLYDDLPNFYRLLGSSLTVVGVFNIEALPCNSQILLEDSVFRTFTETYNREYSSALVGIAFPEGKIEQTVRAAAEKGYRFTDPSLQAVYEWVDLIPLFRRYIIFFVVLFMLLTMMMLLTFVSCSVRDQSRKIGILRAVGVGKRDTLAIFILEAALLTGISLLVGVVASLVLLGIVNSKFASLMSIANPLTLFFVNPLSMILAVLAILLFSLLSVWLPIRSFSKKKPIDVIRN